MKSLLIATTNPGKLREFSELLAPLFVCDALPKGLPPVLEDGTSYQENALKKAVGYFELCHRPVLADDSGLEVDALQGRPGIHSAYYGGEQLSWPERWETLYSELKSLRSQSPATELFLARFRCVLCYYDGLQPPQFFEGITEGTLSLNPKGSKGFGYDPIFFSPELGKTLGEASSEEKARISHRARAVKAFLTSRLP